MMLKGICPKCGREYYGWALQNEEYRGCDQCDGRLHVIQEAGAIKKSGNPDVPITQKDLKMSLH